MADHDGSYSMSTPRRTTGGSGGLHDSALGRTARIVSSTEDKLREEVHFLQNKLKYVQSISTIFRQKVALIMRECSKNPSSFQDFNRMYAKVLGDVTRAEQGLDNVRGSDDVTALGSPRREFGDGDAVAAAPSAKTTSQAARDDVMKAHQLCVILQEKNDLKKREVELREKCEKLQAAYEEVSERHNRLVELEATGAGGIAQAQLEAFRAREANLEKALMEARTDAMRLRVASGKDAPHDPGVDPALAESTLYKQNQLLKSRVQRLKDEAARAAHESMENSKQLQVNIDTLVTQVQRLKDEVKHKEVEVRHAKGERAELAAELVHERSVQETLSARVNALENELRAMSALSGNGTDGTSRSGSAGGNAVSHGNNADVDALQYELDEARAEKAEVEQRLFEAEKAARLKDVEIKSLGAQIHSFRSRIEAFEAENDQRDVQRAMVNDVQQRMLAAVSDIQNAQTTVALTQKMGGISEQLQRLESLELQLRQKEDLLALSEDELAQLKASHAELLESLNAVSALFMDLPKSTSALERLVVELKEYKDEVVECADAREIPDVVAVQGRIELRCLEAETARRTRRESILDEVRDQHRGGTTTGSGASPTAPASLFDDADETAPPPPALVDITAGLNSTPVGALLSEADGGGTSLQPVGTVSDEDVRITFQLFDEKNTGVLPADVVRLCLTTLGLPPSLLPSGTNAMTSGEFLALCSGRGSDDR